MGYFDSNFAFPLAARTHVVPLIVILSDKHEGEQKRTQMHEEQHWIHTMIMHVFSSLEDPRHALPDSPERIRQRATKDELLAFAREGIFGKEFIYQFLNAYQNEFGLNDRSKNKALRKKLRQNIQIISHKMQKSRLARFGSQGRSLLVYHLCDIPLDRFSDWIDLLDRYYDHRKEELFAFIKDLKTQTSRPNHLARVIALEEALHNHLFPYKEAVLGLTSKGTPFNWRQEIPKLLRNGIML